jgi:hypothetical protein
MESINRDKKRTAVLLAILIVIVLPIYGLSGAYVATTVSATNGAFIRAGNATNTSVAGTNITRATQGLPSIQD